MKPDLWTVAAGIMCLAIAGPARADEPASDDAAQASADEPADGDDAAPAEEEDAPASDEGDDGPSVTASGSSTSEETDVDTPDLSVNTEPEPEPEGPPLLDKRRRHIPWIRRWRPERNLVELGIYGGVFIPAEDHDFYDPRTRPQEPLWAAGADVGFRLGYYPLRPLGVEAEFSANPTRVRSVNDDFVFVFGFRGHVVAQLPFYSVIPFFLAGYGLMGVRSNIILLGDDIDPAFHYGGGLKVFASRNVGFRVEARNIISSAEARQDSGTSHIQVLAGLSFTFNRKKPVPPPPKPIPPDPDRDKDGILNETDECPDTAGVEPHGCPDTDGDGFIDKVDDCPEVPGIAPKGCPDKDTDGDGYMDSVDQCPYVPENFNEFEDEDGCKDVKPIEKFEGVLEGIEFDFNKDTIRDSSKDFLDEGVETLKANPWVKIRIVGHTDDKGSKRFNQKLSERRAEAVKQYFVDGGIDANRIETEGKGQSSPRADNGTEEGRAQNRRIEIVITEREKPREAGEDE